MLPSSAVTITFTSFSPTCKLSVPVTDTVAVASSGSATTFTFVTLFGTFAVYNIIIGSNVGLIIPSCTSKDPKLALLLESFTIVIV